MKKKVYAYLHTHWDIEWYRNKQEFDIRFCEVFDVILEELKNNKAPFFYLDGQTISIINYLKYRKNKLSLIKKFIKENKLAIGPYYTSIDSYLVSYPMMLKNLEIGLGISKDFGQKEFIGYLSDIFGISKSSFCALEEKNLDKSIIWRGVNPEKISNNCDFLYKNIKTTWLAQGYFNDFVHNDNISGLENYLDKIFKYSKSEILLPIGGDHLGILTDANNKINEINKKLKNYKIILTSPFEYFKKTKYTHKTKEKEFLDNSNTYTLSGVYSARIPQKIKNCNIQNKLSRIVEPLNFYLKDKYKENIEEIYKELLQNHAHDGIYGCSIDSVHRAINSRQEKCEQALSAILKRIIGNFKIKNKITGKIKEDLGIFNLSNTNFNVVEIKLPYKVKNSQIIKKEKGFCDELLYDINKIPVTEDITTLYTQLVEISSNEQFEFNVVKIQKPKTTHKITQNKIENQNIKLEIKNNKVFVTNKKINEKIELKLTDINDSGDSYNFAPKGEYRNLELNNAKIRYQGEIESCLELNYKNIKLYAYLNNYDEFIRFGVKINNKTKNHKLQLVLKTNDNISNTIAQDAYGIIERKIDYNYKMQDFMPAIRPYELKSNSFPAQNFVCANNLCAMTKGLNEYEIYKNELRICLLRCFSTISNPKNPARAVPAGPDLKTPQAQCLFEFEAEFAILFGNHQKAFENLDKFFKNYVAIDGDFIKKNNIKLDELPNNSYIYCLHENKKIIYNYKNKNES